MKSTTKYLALIPALLVPLFRAAAGEPPPALVELASVTIVDGSVFYRPGDLIVGHPSLPGRPGLRPMAGADPVQIPADLSDYEDLSSACPRVPPVSHPQQTALGEGVVIARGDMGADGRIEHVTVRRSSLMDPPRVLVFRDEELLADAYLPMPAQPCTALVAEASPGASPDLILLWSSRGYQGLTIGVLVFRLP